MKIGPVLVFVSACALASCAADPGVQQRQHVARGDEYLKAGEYRKAIIEYRNALKIASDLGDVHLHVGDAYFALGDGINASLEYQRAAELLPSSIEAQVKAANFLLLSGQFDEVVARTAKILDKDPENVDALILRGNALTQKRDFDDALNDIEQALALAPDSGSPYLVLGRLKLAEGKRSDAEAAYVKAATLGGSSAIPHLTLGQYYWLTGDRAKAEHEFNTALELEPDNLRAHRAAALLNLSEGRRDEAERHLRLIVKNAHDVSSQLALADFLVLADRIDEAVQLLRPLAAQPTTLPQAGTRLAAIADRRGELDAARKQIMAVLVFSPRYAPALVLQARFQLLDGKIDDALESVKLASEVDQRSAAARYLLGAIHAARGDVELAVTAFDEVLRLSPRSAETMMQLSRLHLRAGRTARGLELARQSVMLEPNLLEGRLALARAYLANGQTALATREVEAVANKFPKSSEVQALEGTMKLLRNDLQGARLAFSKSLELDQDSIEALAGLVVVDLALHQYDAATSLVEKRLKQHPNDLQGLLLAARTYATSGHRDYAERLLRNALEVSPNSFDAYQELARLYASQGKLEEGRHEFEALVKRVPASVPAGTMLAVILHLEGRVDDAQREYERVVALDRTAAVAANNLAWMYAQQEINLDRAQELAEAAQKELPRRAEVSDTLGWVYVKKKLWTNAVWALEASVKDDPKNAVYAYHLGVALAGTGRNDQAKKSLQSALARQAHFDGAREAAELLKTLSAPPQPQ